MERSERSDEQLAKRLFFFLMLLIALDALQTLKTAYKGWDQEDMACLPPSAETQDGSLVAQSDHAANCEPATTFEPQAGLRRKW